jgi:isoamylase
LQSLGVTAVELMPVFEFPGSMLSARRRRGPNYWGYDPLAFFAPHRGYAVGDEPGVPGPRVQGDGAGACTGRASR